MLDDKKRIELAKRLINALQSQLSFIKNAKHYGTTSKTFYKNSILSKVKFINYLLDKTTFFEMSKFFKDKITKCSIDIYYKLNDVNYKASFVNNYKDLFINDIDERIFEAEFLLFLDKVSNSLVDINSIQSVDVRSSFKSSPDINYIITIPEYSKTTKDEETPKIEMVDEELTKKIEKAREHRKQVISEIRKNLRVLLDDTDDNVLGMLGVFDEDIKQDVHIKLAILDACERLFISFYHEKCDRINVKVYYIPRGSKNRHFCETVFYNDIFDVDLYDEHSELKSGGFYLKMIDVVRSLSSIKLVPLELKISFENGLSKDIDVCTYDLTNGSILSDNK